MPNRGKRLFAAFAASIALAASGLVAAPASAQAGGGGYYHNCNDITTGGYGTGYGCCQYDPYWDGWYRMYATHWEPCTPPYGAPEPSDDSSPDVTEPQE